jgi:hypothetical protein
VKRTSVALAALAAAIIGIATPATAMGVQAGQTCVKSKNPEYQRLGYVCVRVDRKYRLERIVAEPVVLPVGSSKHR